MLSELGETAPQDYRDELGVGREGPVTVEVSEPILVHTWTREAVQGLTAPGEHALESSDEWVAVGWVDGNPSSLITAYRNEAGEAAYAGITISTDTAEALMDLAPGDTLVYEFPLNAYLAVNGDQIRGLNSDGRLAAQGITTVEDYTVVLVERYAEDLTRPADTDLVGGAADHAEEATGTWWVGVGLATVVALLAGAATSRFTQRQRRPVTLER